MQVTSRFATGPLRNAAALWRCGIADGVESNLRRLMMLKKITPSHTHFDELVLYLIALLLEWQYALLRGEPYATKSGFENGFESRLRL